MSYQTDVEHDKGCPREFNAEPRGRHDECTCDNDRVEELLKEIVKVVREQSPMASGVDLDYRIGDIDVNLMMRPVTGTLMAWSNRRRHSAR